MIIGIGTDIVNISRIKNVHSKFGDKFLEKYFTENEIQYARQKSKNFHQSLASAWAVKEAFSKAVSTGFTNGIYPKSIELCRTAKGAPNVVLYDKAIALLQRLSGMDTTKKLPKILTTISHDNGIAIAFIIIEKDIT